jgi:hypothetical protein
VRQRLWVLRDTRISIGSSPDVAHTSMVYPRSEEQPRVIGMHANQARGKLRKEFRLQSPARISPPLMVGAIIGDIVAPPSTVWGVSIRRRRD